MLLSWNGLFHLVQKAHPHSRVEVSDLLLLNPVPAYTPENKALQVLNSYWYSKQQSVLHPRCYFQVPLKSDSLISRFELSMPFSVRCIAIHSSQKKLLEHLACMVSFVVTTEEYTLDLIYTRMIHSSKTDLSLATLVKHFKNEWDSDKDEADNNIPWIWGTERLEIKVECWMINGCTYEKPSQISL